MSDAFIVHFLAWMQQSFFMDETYLSLISTSNKRFMTLIENTPHNATTMIKTNIKRLQILLGNIANTLQNLFKNCELINACPTGLARQPNLCREIKYPNLLMNLYLFFLLFSRKLALTSG